MDGSTTARVDYGSEEAAMQAYLRDGERRAAALGNRGPIRFTAAGELHPDILEAYGRCGFYVFEGVLKPDELADIERDLQRHPRPPAGRARRGARRQAAGRRWRPTARGPTCCGPSRSAIRSAAPICANGRHPVKMFEPQAAAGAPKEVVYLILGSLQFSEAALRVYGHPQLLAVAAAINGPDFTPFNEALFIKEPGRGASVAWHQDGTTHWDSPEWDEGIHGFNFMGQLYGCTAANGVWVVPGSHKQGKIDIKSGGRGRHRAAARRRADDLRAGRRRHHQPPGAARLVRQHQQGLARDGELGLPSPHVGAGREGRRRAQQGSRLRRRAHRERARLIGYGIDARRQRFPDETPFVYRPHADAGLAYRWDDEARAAIRDYNLLDLSI